jgi:hypothetical protein
MGRSKSLIEEEMHAEMMFIPHSQQPSDIGVVGDPFPLLIEFGQDFPS